MICPARVRGVHCLVLRCLEVRGDEERRERRWIERCWIDGMNTVEGKGRTFSHLWKFEDTLMEYNESVQYGLRSQEL